MAFTLQIRQKKLAAKFAEGKEIWEFNYYVVYESYGFSYRDRNYRPYHIKDGQFRNVSYKGNERKESFLPLDSDEVKKYYHIFIQVGLTGNENGREEDYMSLDLVAEIASLDDRIEFEVLSHGVM